MDFVNGNDRILYIRVNGIFVPVGCLDSNSFNESSEMLDTTTRDNAGWYTSLPTLQEYSITFSGLQVNSTVNGGNFELASYDRLVDIKRKKIRVEWKIQGDIFPIIDYGFGYISEIGEVNSVDEFMSFSGTIKGFGEPHKTTYPTVLLNNGNPDIVIATNEANKEILRTSKF